MVQISVNLPQYPEGEEIAITGLGRFPNGGDAVEVDEDTVAAFEQQRGMSIQDALQYSPGWTVDGKAGQEPEETTDVKEEVTTDNTSTFGNAPAGEAVNEGEPREGD
jgi:hypothetical protein